MYEYEQQVQNVQKNTQNNTVDGIELLGDAIETVAEIATNIADLPNIAEAAGKMVGETADGLVDAVEAVGDIAEAVGGAAEAAGEAASGVGDILGEIFDAADALPIVLIVGAGAAVVGGVGYGIYKLVNLFKKK